jgi:DNA-binding PadR family transcriptional regulator
MADVPAGSLYGTLNLLILRTLAGRETLHGLEIQRRIRHVSQDVLQIEVGALYPALHKFYAITPKGLKRLERETKRWESHTAAVGRILTEAPGSVG